MRLSTKFSETRQPRRRSPAEAVVVDVAKASFSPLGMLSEPTARRGSDLAVGQASLAADRLGRAALPVAVDAGDPSTSPRRTFSETSSDAGCSRSPGMGVAISSAGSPLAATSGGVRRRRSAAPRLLAGAERFANIT